MKYTCPCCGVKNLREGTRDGYEAVPMENVRRNGNQQVLSI